ncbi:DUF2971 domain-containing protein [Flavobacterium ponti]|uniref:DUF2971 domain-containing protein n=1 Tax=Flavobacterium ponti TaxID=665133 RepID=A0ABV9P7Z4_9FLAO
MKVYKYRGSDDRKIFERDLFSLEKNYFWAPDFNSLNDPCETTINKDNYLKQSNFILSFFARKNKSTKFQPVIEAVKDLLEFTKKIGIFSLSKTFKDELLWAHYANSHKGFCIEYDLDILLNTYQSINLYSFPVIYKKEPPSIDLKDIINPKNIIQKMSGYKSLRWKYEEEIRVITENYGEHSYDFIAVKSIYFGLRMLEKDKLEIKNRLKGRGINFYQMERIPKTYKFESVLIPNMKENNITYLCQIQKANKEKVNYKIVEKNYFKYKEKATITILLSDKINITELNSIAEIIKNDIFRQANKIFISYILEGSLKGEGYWATSRYLDNKLNTTIQGLSLEQEKTLIKGLKNETRDAIGMWIDETPHVSCSMKLLQLNDEIILETIYFDGSKSSEKMKSKLLNNKKRYDYLETKKHNEYFVIDENGFLNFYSEKDLFRTLKPFNK